MADKKEKPEVAEAPSEPNKTSSKKKLVVIISAIVVLAALGGGGFFWWKKEHDKRHAKPKAAVATNGAHGQEEAEDEDDGKPPIFTPLEKIVVKLQRGRLSVDHYVQVSIELRIADAKVAEKMKQSLPIIQYEVMLILSSKDFEWMDPVENKKKLAQEIRDRINKIIKSESTKEGVRAVYFTSFILQ